MGSETDDSGKEDPSAIRFLRSLVAPEHAVGGHRELGTTPLARQLGLPDDQLGGHWCSRCEGIWYGCALEVECPRCGNRRG
jgi:hypothetical protein